EAVVTETESVRDKKPQQQSGNSTDESQDLNKNINETAETEPYSSPEDENEALREELEIIKREADAYKDKALRAQAELQNAQKRAARDIENAHKYALEKFLGDLLPVLDSMELGIDASGSAGDIESLREGMDLTLKKFRDTLEKAGITVIDPQGEKFNPELHEAVTMQESSENQSGTVISVMQKGYELNGRLIRPAMVIVAK
ncbi:MAG TPA: nucleotide exchange factor GrpE, partial [Gammaproteobacteria bacterium]|nr:nucleotide exchange factor GrpE [Gammaproteobacteria bacterium]